jgi:hypothetical protein
VAWVQMMTHDWFAHDTVQSGKNTETHWWDSSMIYGSSAETNAELRTGQDGKLKLNKDDEIAYKKDTRGKDRPETGFSENFWVGLHVLHTVLAREVSAPKKEKLHFEYRYY